MGQRGGREGGVMDPGISVISVLGRQRTMMSRDVFSNN